MRRVSAYALMIGSEILGGGSLVLFAIFVFAGPVVSFRLGFEPRFTLLWDGLLSLLFFAQHSIMVRRSFKDWLARRMPRAFHGAVYSIGSGIALAIAMGFWQRSTTSIVTLVGPVAWLLRSAGILAVAGFVWGIRSLKTFDTFGRRPATAWLRGKPLSDSKLVVRGAYQWVRHPLMFFMLVLMWSNPAVTADRLLFNVLWTVWLVVGVRFEERDLVAEFGDDYRAYQRVVPMVLPWRGPAGRTLQRLEPTVTAGGAPAPTDERFL